MLWDIRFEGFRPGVWMLTTGGGNVRDSSVLSAALQSAWAKSLPRDVPPTHHLPLVQHCGDAGAVAGRLWDEWLPRAVRERFTAHLGVEARAVVQWLAASHDVGKLSPAFAGMTRSAASARGRRRRAPRARGDVPRTEVPPSGSGRLAQPLRRRACRFVPG